MKIPDNVAHAIQRQNGLYAPVVLPTGQSDVPLAIMLFGNFDKAGISHGHKTIFLPAEVVQTIKEIQVQTAQQQWNNGDRDRYQTQREPVRS